MYWQLDPKTKDYLFVHNTDISPCDCDVVVLDSEWLFHNSTLPKEVLGKKKPYQRVFIDLSDGVIGKGFNRSLRDFDVVLKTHFNDKVVGYPSNMLPWTYGITNRIIQALQHRKPWRERKKTLVTNFRIMHQSRVIAQNEIYPLLEKKYKIDTLQDPFTVPTTAEYDKLMWHQTGRRHYPEYYKKISNSQLLSCFGGFFYYRRVSLFRGRMYFTPIQFISKHSKIQGIIKYISEHLTQKHLAFFQWDSYRLWESFVAETLTLTVDFVSQGLKLPIMPENRKHYIGIDINNIKEDIAFLLDSTDKTLSSVAIEGRKWALSFYSPPSLARMFLQILGYQL